MKFLNNIQIQTIFFYSIFIQYFSAFKLKFEETDDESSANVIMVKKYKSQNKSTDKPLGKTLQVQNIPPYATVDSIRRVFEIAGPIESVNLFDKWENENKSKFEVPSKYFSEPLPFTFKIGIIVYKKSISVDVLLKCKELPPLSTEEHPVLTGVKKWVAEYNRIQSVNADEMMEEINVYMKHHDKVIEEGERQDVEDDDGWTVVPKKGQNSGFRQTPGTVNKLQEKMKKQKSGLKNFYTFEVRESKKSEMMNLKRKFDVDKERLRAMKKRKTFMPL